MTARRNIGRTATVLLCSALVAGGVSAAGEVTELHLFRAGGWLHAGVRARNLLDERTRLTIESGLPGTCIYRFRLEERAGGLVTERYVEMSLRFDLWEDRYVLEGGEATRTLPTLAAADSALSRVADLGICPLARLQPAAEYRLLIDVAVRPLAPEDRQRLSHYVSRNSGGGSEDVAIDLSGVFNHILGDKGKARPAVQHAGPVFRVAELAEAP